MNESGKTYSKAAVAAFILAVAPPAFFLLIEFLDLFIHIHSWGFNEIYAYTLIFCGSLTILLGLVLSIVGLINCNRHNLRGKGLAVTGLIFCILELMVALIAVALAAMYKLGGGR